MKIQSVGIIGAGTMGNGIAQVCAVAGLDVVMIDMNDAAVQRGIEQINTSLDRLIKKTVLTVAAKEIVQQKIKGSTSYNDLAGLSIIIEAATENQVIKEKILQQIDEIVSPETIIATNTSSLSITKLAALNSNPARFIGMNPGINQTQHSNWYSDHVIEQSPRNVFFNNETRLDSAA